MRNKENTANPYNWNKISGNKYFEICDVLSDKDSDDLTKQAELIALIEDIDVDAVYDLPINDFAEKAAKLKFLNSFDTKEYNKLKSIVIAGDKYDVISDITKLTYGQYVDYQSFIKQPFRDNYYKILSLVIIPEGHKYNTDYDITEIHDVIRNYLSWPEVQGLLGFFLRVYVHSYNHSLTSIRKLIKKTKDEKVRKDLETKLDRMVKAARSLIGYVSQKTSPIFCMSPGTRSST